MKKTKDYTVPLTDEDHLDIRLVIESGKTVGFVLNLRCRIGDAWHQVYRVDTAHGYLHEQRFWISPEPIALIKHVPLEYMYEFYLNQIRENFRKYRTFYIERMGIK